MKLMAGPEEIDKSVQSHLRPLSKLSQHKLQVVSDKTAEMSNDSRRSRHSDQSLPHEVSDIKKCNQFILLCSISIPAHGNSSLQ